MVTKKRSLLQEFSKILETHGINDPLLVGQLVGVVEAVYAKKPKDPSAKLDPRTHPFTVSFQTHIGYPFPNFAKELKFADWIFKHGYTADQAMACYDEMKRGWWKDKRVGLNNVADALGEFVARSKPVQSATPALSEGALELKRKMAETQAFLKATYAKQ